MAPYLRRPSLIVARVLIDDAGMTIRRYPDMWVDPQDDPRSDDPVMGSERDTLLQYLTFHRLTLQMKCSGLDAAAMAKRSVEPSSLSLLGLVRHLADVERSWSRRIMARQEVALVFRTAEDADAAFTGATADDALVAQAWAAWREEVAFTDRYLEQNPDLETIGERGGQPIMLREVLIHLIEEYARHIGHADLLRERIDGRTGQ